jgi:hypothetical protein
MNKEIFGRGLQLINAVSNHQIDTQDQIEAYYLLLNDLDGKTYLNAVIALLRVKKNLYNPPTPGEIREYYEKEFDKSSNIENIIDYIKRDILLFGKRKQPKYKKEISNTIKKIGGWEYICSLENSTYLESEFKKEYKNYLKEKNFKEIENKN